MPSSLFDYLPFCSLNRMGPGLCLCGEIIFASPFPPGIHTQQNEPQKIYQNRSIMVSGTA